MEYRNYSRLPDVPDYWESLATRIERTRDDGRGWLRAAAIVATLSAAAMIASLLIPAPRQTDLAELLAPGDPVAALFMESK